VRPDNCIVEMPFRPELDRYGGRQLLPLSLRMFWFTSLRALEFALMQPSLGRPRATALSIRYLLRLSLCLSRNPIDRLQLWQTNGGDRHLFREYLKRREVVFDIFRQEEGTIPVEWQRAGDELLMKLSVTESSTRLGILRSQIHMFANRLGLSYAEELAFYFFFQSVQKSSNWEDHIQKGDIP
jgi:Lantibiotic biosynthesis dehydratase C-term